MNKENLREVLSKINQQHIDQENKKNMLTTQKKEIIYHDIVKTMMRGENSYSLLKFGTETIFAEHSLQKQIRDWLQKDHQIECIRKYVDINDYTNDYYYYVAIW